MITSHQLNLINSHRSLQSNGDIVVTRALDRETVPSYTFQVIAQDMGKVPRKSSVSVVVTVLDVNDNR